jgi:predicted trehalose synthase
MKPNRLAVYGLTAGLLGGGAAGLVLTGSTLAGAQVSDVTGTVTDPSAAGSAKRAKGEWAKSVLDGLVAKGTITQAQADEILAALNAARPAHGPGGKGHGRAFGKLAAAARALGMSVEDLRAALAGGKSLAAVAQEKGIDVARIVDALLAEFKARLDQEVASGIHTQAEADQKLAGARARIEAFVNGTAPAGGLGGGRHGRGPRGTTS